jgi:hypothetical protein
VGGDPSARNRRSDVINSFSHALIRIGRRAGLLDNNQSTQILCGWDSMAILNCYFIGLPESGPSSMPALGRSRVKTKKVVDVNVNVLVAAINFAPNFFRC